MTANENTASWWALDRGDIDATIAQLGFNIAQLIIPAFLLLPVGIPLVFSVTHLLPGYALGFFVGSAGLTSLAISLKKREGRGDVTAHPYGSNVPAMIAYTLTIMLPVYLQSHDQVLAWQVGAAAVIWTGIFKLAAAPFAGAIRRWIPVPASMTVFAAAMYSYLALVLLQRIFDSPLVGVIALAILCSTVLVRLPITKWRIPPFLFVWLVPMAVGLGIGYIHPVWTGVKPGLPGAYAPGLLHAMQLVLPYLSVIVPMSVYQIVQDIAAAEGAATVGDNYDARGIVAWDGIGTLVCGLAGSVVCPIVYAILPPYKALGAKISYVFWTGTIFLVVVMSGITMFATQLFPWSILASMIAYITVGVGHATFHRVDRKYLSAVLLGLMLPAGAVVTGAVGSALPALHLSIANPEVQAALNRSIYWNSLQGLGNGFLLLVLVVAALITEMIDRNFNRAAVWCLLAAAFSWVGLMHSPVIRWGAQPMYAIGWLAAAAIALSAHLWRGDLGQPAPASPAHAPAKEVAVPHR
jgi:AGZA family xanthine/uracil permease-like MFS transporter